MPTPERNPRAQATPQRRLDISKVRKFGAIFYGFGGVGKTTVLRTAVEAAGGWERVLWINTDRPIETFDYHEFTPDEPYGVVNMLDQPVEVVRKALKSAERAHAKGESLYDIAVLDGISETERVNFAKLDNNTNARDKRQVWGAQSGDIQDLVWAFRPQSLGSICLMTARVREVSDPEEPDDENKRMLRPAVRGEFGLLIDHYYNLELYVGRKGNTRKMYLKPSGRIHVKNDWEHLVGFGKSPMDVPDLDKGNAFVNLIETLQLKDE